MIFLSVLTGNSNSKKHSRKAAPIQSLLNPLQPNRAAQSTIGAESLLASQVKTITVTCKTNNIAVGGKASGLSGRGLGLQLNGTYDIAINKNGDFVFPDVRLSDNSDYRVAIKTMPVKQLCTIKPISSAQQSGVLNIIEVVCMKK